jgi:methylenetetrahydrofolate reductase (NADPH)
VRFIRSHWDFSLAVAGYPETHPEARSPQEDIAYLGQKLEAGAELVLTQLFFDVERYRSFVGAARSAGITVPIVPGLMPVSSLSQLERLSKMCSASIPQNLRVALAEVATDAQAQLAVGTEFSVRLAKQLLESGAPGLHIYSLNQALQVEQILKRIF